MKVTCLLVLQLLLCSGAKLVLGDTKVKRADNAKNYEHYQSEALLTNENEIEPSNKLDHQHRHFAQQTTFDGIDETVSSTLSFTSAPKLAIDPSPVVSSTVAFARRNSISSHDIHSTQSIILKACTSEKSTMDFVTSHTLKSSLLAENEISFLAGYIETQERTHSLSNAFGQMHLLSQPSTKLVLDA